MFGDCSALVHAEQLLLQPAGLIFTAVTQVLGKLLPLVIAQLKSAEDPVRKKVML